MFKLVCAICICLAAVPAVCQSTGKYRLATITCVTPHQAASDFSSDIVSYDVCVKVDDTIYVVLYTPPLKLQAVKYAAGRDLLVLVGKKTITYSDILGQSLEVPILSQKPAADTKH